MNMDVNKPVENPRLKDLLTEYKDPEKEDKKALAEKIAEELAMNACMLAVIDMDDDHIEHKADGTAIFKQNAVLSFEMIKDANGISYLPVYTDWNELNRNESYKNVQVKTLILSFDDMAAISSGKAGIVINPFSDSFIITPSDLVSMKRHKDDLSRGYTTNVVEKETTVQIGEPADYPTEMAESIKRCAKTEKAIKAIWLKLMIRDNEKSYLLIIDFEGDRETVFSSIASEATKHIRNGIPVDMVSFDEPFGRKAATGEPIYKRKKGLFSLW